MIFFVNDVFCKIFSKIVILHINQIKKERERERERDREKWKVNEDFRKNFNECIENSAIRNFI